MINKYFKIITSLSIIIFTFWGIISLYFFPIDFLISIYSSSDDLLEINSLEFSKAEQDDFSYINLLSFQGSHISEISSKWWDKVDNNCIEVMNTECNGKLVKFLYFNQDSHPSDLDNIDKKNVIQNMNKDTVCTFNTSCEIINIFYSKDGNKKNSTKLQIISTNNISDVLIQECTQSQTVAANCLNINTQTTSGSKIIDTIQDFVNSSAG
jgi:hypothetical protein